MAGRGAPVGNNNAGKGAVFRNALNRAIAQDNGQLVRKAADKLLELAAKGEAWAVRELADRLDGKAAQSIMLSQDEENPLFDTLKNSDELRKKLRGMAPAIIQQAQEQESGIHNQQTPEGQQYEQTDPE